MEMICCDVSISLYMYRLTREEIHIQRDRWLSFPYQNAVNIYKLLVKYFILFLLLSL
jgi:hypothetical protein